MRLRLWLREVRRALVTFGAALYCAVTEHDIRFPMENGRLVFRCARCGRRTDTHLVEHRVRIDGRRLS